MSAGDIDTELHHNPHSQDDENVDVMPVDMVGDLADGGCDSDDAPPDSASLRLETSWGDRPIRLPAYTPSVAAKENSLDSPPTTPVDDPIYTFGSKKHFGFSARQSIASSIFPWHKNKPQVFHQYSPSRPPLSKRSSLSGLKVLPIFSPGAVKHLDDEEIDILTCKGLDLAKRTLEVLHKLEIPAWQDVTDPTQLEFFRISGAMTNCIFQVSGPPFPAAPSAAEVAEGDGSEEQQPPKRRKVLLRVYGIGTDALFSREKELYWLQNLAMMDIGPPLLGIFKNGRFEEYIESTTLTKEDIRDPRNSRHIAHRMCELHNLVNVLPPPEHCVSQTQENIYKWLPLAKEAIEKICAKDPSKRQVMDDFDFNKLLAEIDEVYVELSKTQYGNILRTTDGSGELVVIDFEYAGYNTRGFDIGNHFCEWTADYHSDRPSVLHPDRYPTKAEQLNFLEAYMEAEIAMTGYHLTAINIEKYNQKYHRRRSIRNAVASGIAKAVAATSSALRRRSTEGGVVVEPESGVEQEQQQSSSQPLAPSSPPQLQKQGSTTSSISAATTTSTESLEESSTTTFVTTNGEGGVQGGTMSPKSDAAAVAAAAGGKGNSALENEATIKAAAAQTAVSRRKGGDGGGGVSKAEILDSMYKEVNKFALTSHIMWGLWGLIQAPQSEIEFDYFEYALQRLTEFRRRRPEFMGL
ncbi:hypothetical protein DFQ27_000843 [Actinomortierella ambigua]|uniref:Choline kinase n=1 Tax=Actinomortierella ambigua TaxID=1343610 RepID=A0A9P6QGL1_9FUNG|nr:hypothetical protein DFQ27_000843 [Actinomortierella ambigua]